MGISFGTVQTILTDILSMSKVLARWVPRMLTDDQNRCRLDISNKVQVGKDQEKAQSHSKNRGGKKKQLTIRHLYHENIS